MPGKDAGLILATMLLGVAGAPAAGSSEADCCGLYASGQGAGFIMSMDLGVILLLGT